LLLKNKVMAKTKIKVCFFSLQAYSLFNPKNKSNFGGAELQSFLLSKELVKDPRFDVSFIVGDFGQREFENKYKIKIYKLNNSFCQETWREKIIFSFNLFKLLKKIDVDIYIQRALGTTTGVFALFCKIFGKKFIFMSAHENDLNVQKINKTWRGKFSYFGIKNADLFLTQNVEHQKLLLKNYGKTSIVFKNVLEFPKKMNKHSKQTILWVASSQPFKRPGLFLKIAQSFLKEKFEMVMPRHPHYKNLYLKIIKQAQKIPNLKIFGRIPFSKIGSFFKRAKVFVNTSESEGFPNTFVQAASCAVPILSLKVNPDNFLEKYNCGFCAKNNFKKLTKYMKILLKNKNIWSQLSKNSYNYAKKNHDIKKNIVLFKKYLLTLHKKRQKTGTTKI